MKRGLMRGWVRRSRQKRLVYHSLGGGQIFILPAGGDGLTTGADIATAWTRTLFNWQHNADIEQYPAVPADGSLRGLSVTLIARNTTTVGVNTLYVMDYDDDTNPIGQVAVSGRGYGLYFGKVANLHDALHVPFVKCDSSGRIKYNVGWASGTAQYYIRMTGYWTEEIA
jgi:hypothetical protein